MRKNTITRAKNKLYGEIAVPLMEKEFTAEGITLHYLLFRRHSPVLIIGFQGGPDHGKPRYNYLSTLSGINANRLYIKDDIVPNGNYYLGSGGKFNMEAATRMLIADTIRKCGAEKTILIGSSKGGYAAINYGIEIPGSVMIAASPQYWLGNYMSSVRSLRFGMEDVLGLPVTKEKLSMLNGRLKEKIGNDPYAETQKVYIHCSVNDMTYHKHVLYLQNDLAKAGVQQVFDKRDYEGHETLKYYFPQYLRATAIYETAVYTEGGHHV